MAQAEKQPGFQSREAQQVAQVKEATWLMAQSTEAAEEGPMHVGGKQAVDPSE
jgi:hypothetical protein